MMRLTPALNQKFYDAAAAHGFPHAVRHRQDGPGRWKLGCELGRSCKARSDRRVLRLVLRQVDHAAVIASEPERTISV